MLKMEVEVVSRHKFYVLLVSLMVVLKAVIFKLGSVNGFQWISGKEVIN